VGINKINLGKNMEMKAWWRPITALSITAIMLNQFMILPYVALFAKASPGNLPIEFWGVAGAFLGAYTIGRSVEKTTGKQSEK